MRIISKGDASVPKRWSMSSGGGEGGRGSDPCGGGEAFGYQKFVPKAPRGMNLVTS